MLHDKGQPALVQEVIARRIVEIAKTGERDSNRICERRAGGPWASARRVNARGANPAHDCVSARGFACGRAVADQPVALRSDGFIALAGRFPEPFQVGDLDASAAVADQACCLQRVGHQRDAVVRRARRASAPGISGSGPRCRCRSRPASAGASATGAPRHVRYVAGRDCCAWANCACSCRISVGAEATLWSATSRAAFRRQGSKRRLRPGRYPGSAPPCHPARPNRRQGCRGRPSRPRSIVRPPDRRPARWRRCAAGRPVDALTGVE